MIVLVSLSYYFVEILLNPRLITKTCYFILLMIFYYLIIILFFLFGIIKNCQIYLTSVIISIICLTICYVVCLIKIKENKLVHVILLEMILALGIIVIVNILWEVKL